MPALMAEPPPRVSVLMTTRNGAPLIAESIDSVLAQEFRNFELVMVDDASTDATPALLAAYASRDARVRILRTPCSLGVVGARNHGFAACRGEFVAMLDHDDLSHPGRLAAQVVALEAAPRTVLIGTEVLLLENGRARITDHRAAASPLLLRWMLHVDNPLTWSSVMLRAGAVRRLGAFLRPDFEYADDFDLYHRLLAIGDVARLEAVLTTYRWHARNTSHHAGGLLSERAVRILAGSYRSWLGDAAEDAAALVVRHLSDRQPPPDRATLARLGRRLGQVLEGFCAAHAMTSEERTMVAAHAAGIWWRAVRSTVRVGRPLAVMDRHALPTLCRGPAPPFGDWVTSVAVGLVRAAPPARRLVARLSGRHG